MLVCVEVSEVSEVSKVSEVSEVSIDTAQSRPSWSHEHVHRRAAGRLADQMSSPGDYLSDSKIRSGGCISESQM